MFLDECASRFDFVPHEHAEHFICCGGIGQLHFQHGSIRGIQCGFAKLLCVHFTQPFKASDRKPSSARFTNCRKQAAQIVQTADEMSKTVRDLR